MADKYLVRDWVKEKVGEEYLIPLLGVYDKFEDIDFDKLPNQFVIKCNHGSGYNIIVKDKSKLNLVEVKAKLDKWVSKDYTSNAGMELHYWNIPHKIIIEKFIQNEHCEDLNDYKFYCFDGDVKYIQVVSDRTNGAYKVCFYDKNWNKQSWWNNVFYEKEIEKPHKLIEMIKLASKLSEEFNFVRVDLYHLDNDNIYFGEMTFTPNSGIMNWSCDEIDKDLGQLIKLPTKAYNIDTKEYYELILADKQCI